MSDFGNTAGLCHRSGTPDSEPGPDRRADLILKLVDFVEWSGSKQPDSGVPVVIGVLADSALEIRVRSAAEDRPADMRPVAIVSAAGWRRASGCHVALFGDNNDALSAEALDSLHAAGILTVGYGEDFLAAGGVAAIVGSQVKARPAINTRAARRARITIDPGLLHMVAYADDSSTNQTTGEER